MYGGHGAGRKTMINDGRQLGKKWMNGWTDEDGRREESLRSK
jgi:hypothetical protein